MGVEVFLVKKKEDDDDDDDAGSGKDTTQLSSLKMKYPSGYLA